MNSTHLAVRPCSHARPSSASASRPARSIAAASASSRPCSHRHPEHSATRSQRRRRIAGRRAAQLWRRTVCSRVRRAFSARSRRRTSASSAGRSAGRSAGAQSARAAGGAATGSGSIGAGRRADGRRLAILSGQAGATDLFSRRAASGAGAGAASGGCRLPADESGRRPTGCFSPVMLLPRLPRRCRFSPPFVLLLPTLQTLPRRRPAAAGGGAAGLDSGETKWLEKTEAARLAAWRRAAMAA